MHGCVVSAPAARSLQGRRGAAGSLRAPADVCISTSRHVQRSLFIDDQMIKLVNVVQGIAPELHTALRRPGGRYRLPDKKQLDEQARYSVRHCQTSLTLPS